MIRDNINIPISYWQAAFDNQSLWQWFMLATQQLSSQVPTIRLDDLENQSVFPPAPEDGYGLFATPKGMYEAVLSDGSPTTPQWRRMSDGTVFAVGAVIPTTL
jgi:hypothetical protein